VPEESGRRRRGTAHLTEVRAVERITPHLIRLVVGGESLATFGAGEYTDHYLKLLFPVDGVDYPEPFDMQQIRAELPREQWPRTRTYTVRRFDAERREVTIDVVYHGDEGIAGPWAASAKPGDTVRFMGPGGGYAPLSTVDWHLLVGDESALPAIAAALERIPAGQPTHAFVEVAGSADEQKLDTTAAITWLHRGEERPGSTLVRAVRAFAFPAGTVQAFVHGEAGAVKELRRLLYAERGIPRDLLSISGYWRAGDDEDAWQSAKGDWNRQVEAEQARPED
jgi:NADPH-dependent ferric siderophore reductase